MGWYNRQGMKEQRARAVSTLLTHCVGVYCSCRGCRHGAQDTQRNTQHNTHSMAAPPARCMRSRHCETPFCRAPPVTVSVGSCTSGDRAAAASLSTRSQYVCRSTIVARPVWAQVMLPRVRDAHGHDQRRHQRQRQHHTFLAFLAFPAFLALLAFLDFLYASLVSPAPPTATPRSDPPPLLLTQPTLPTRA